MTGIYKITSPSDKIYIGQSTNLHKRFNKYYNLDCKDQRKLYNSLIKYGYENHKFEIIEECDLKILNNKEGYWQDYYECIDKGLNCRRVKEDDKSGFMSEDSKNKMSLSAKIRFKDNDVFKTKLSIIAKLTYSKKVIDINNLIIYNSCTEAAEKNNINKKTLSKKLCGLRKNNTSLMYLDKYEHSNK